MVQKVVCNQPPQWQCNIGKHKSLLAAHRDNEKKFLRQRTKSGRATELHYRKAGYEWKDSSNLWVKKKKKKKGNAKKKVECDKSTETGA